MTLRKVFTASVCCLLVACSGSEKEASSFSLVVLPDTQNYTRFASLNVYEHQTRWILSNKPNRNIKMVAHMGDVTENDVVEEWQVADKAQAILDGAEVPYSMTSGNHDLFPSAETHLRESMFGQYFGPERFAGKDWYGGAFDQFGESNYVYFEGDGVDFLVVSLEFLPRKDVVTWANDLIRRHPAHRVIITTHSYQAPDGEHATGWADRYNIVGREGVDLWAELIQRHSNIFLVLSGHDHGVSYRRRTGLNGNTVHEVLTDFQSEARLGEGSEFGNGWLRVLTFDPERNVVHVETLTTETGNKKIFPGGVPQFFLNYDHIVTPTGNQHNRRDFKFAFDLHATVNYRYAEDDLLYKDRFAHQSLLDGHRQPAIAGLADGSSVAVWLNEADNNHGLQILARVFDLDGNALVDELVVGGLNDGQLSRPQVAADRDGNFIVVWEDDRDGDGIRQLYARGFTADGSERMELLSLSNADSEVISNAQPALAMDEVGHFAVAWQVASEEGAGFAIRVRGFSLDGNDYFPAMTVNLLSSGVRSNPAIAMAPSGEFVVAWEDDNDSDSKFAVFAREYTAAGTPVRPVFEVSGPVGGKRSQPAVAMDGNGNFTVAWQELNGGENLVNRVRFRGFYANGEQRFPENGIELNGDGQQAAPAIVMAANGDFVVTYESALELDGQYQIRAQRFFADGSHRLVDFRVNSDSSGQHRLPAATMDMQGRITFAWQDDRDGDGQFAVLLRNVTF